MLYIGNVDRLDVDECAGWVTHIGDPHTPVQIELIINGQLKNSFLCDSERGDVATVHGVRNCGFSFGMAPFLVKGKNVVRIQIAAQDIALTGGSKTLDTRDQASFVHRGLDGWLFLQNDSNNTDQTLEGIGAFTPEQTRAVSMMYLRRYYTLSALCKRCAFVVIPDKSVLHNEFRTQKLQISKSRRAMQLFEFVNRREENALFYPDKLLERSGLPQIFYKTDTHLCDQALQFLIDFLLDKIGLNVQTALTWVENSEFSGNLGLKLEPTQTEIVLAARPHDRIHILCDEVTPALEASTSLRGARLFYIGNGKLDATLLIIGTSSAYGMLTACLSVFKRVILYWSNEVDDDLVRRLRPDYVFCVITERTLNEEISDNRIISSYFAPVLKWG